MVFVNYNLEPEEDIPSGKTLGTAILFPIISFYNSSIKYIIDDLFNMLYFNKSDNDREFDIIKFRTSDFVEALRRNVKYDDIIDKFPMPNRVAYPLYTNSTGLNMIKLGKPRGKLEKLNDSLKKYQWHIKNLWNNHYASFNLLHAKFGHM